MKHLLIASLLIPALAACKTVQPEPEPVFIPPPVIRTCIPKQELTAVLIPAETEIFYAITMIDNPPYEPIERKERQVRVVKEAYTVYQNAEGEVVENVCRDDLVSKPAVM